MDYVGGEHCTIDRVVEEDGSWFGRIHFTVPLKLSYSGDRYCGKVKIVEAEFRGAGPLRIRSMAEIEHAELATLIGRFIKHGLQVPAGLVERYNNGV